MVRTAQPASVEWNLPRWNHLALLRECVKQFVKELRDARAELSRPLARVDRTWWSERETELISLLSTAEEEFWLLNEPNPARREVSRQKALLQDRARAETWAREERARAHRLAVQQNPSGKTRVGLELPVVVANPLAENEECDAPLKLPVSPNADLRRVVKRGRQELCVEVGAPGRVQVRGANAPASEAEDRCEPPLKPAVAASSRRQRRLQRENKVKGKCVQHFPFPCVCSALCV